MGRVLLVILLLLTTGCSNIASKLLTGGGPNVAANVQAGKENTQNLTLGKQEIVKGNKTTTNKVVETERVETVVVNEVPIWAVLLLILGWVLPTPSQIGNSIISLFRKKKDLTS